MAQKILFLKLLDHKGYDEYYMPLDAKDKTWKSIMESIESALDDKFLDNDSNLEGISLTVEIVREDPDIIDIEDYN